jgi:hypothetical protein
MISINVRFDGLDRLQAQLNAVQKNLGDRAIVSALNKTAAQAKTRMSEAIRAAFNISASLVRERLRVSKAMRQGAATFTAVLIGNPETGGGKRSMNLIHFMEKSVTLSEARRRAARGTKDQLHFKVKRHGGKATLPGAFVGNRGRTVFIRTGNSRLPIKAVRTIGVPQMFNTRKNVDVVQRWIVENFPRIAAAEIRYYLSTIKT